MKVLQEISNWVRYCPNCECSLEYFLLYCQRCEQELYSYSREKQTATVRGVTVHALFNYTEAKIVSNFIHRQKMGNHFEFTKELLQRLAKIDRFEQGLIVPAPGRHALRIAQWLSLKTNLFIYPCLFKSKASKQTRKTRIQRQSVPVLIDRNQMNICSVIFVDDVVTTGATMLRAYQLLGCPSEFEVFCLAVTPSRVRKG